MHIWDTCNVSHCTQTDVMRYFYFGGIPMTNKTKRLTESAMLLSVAIVLELCSKMFIPELPFGGQVTLVSMLPVVLISYRHGVKWGLLAGFANGLLQMLTGWYAPPAGTIGAIIACVLLDYLVAFSCLGLASGISKPIKNRTAAVFTGISDVMFMRFICSFLSGALLWGSYQSYYEWANGMSVWMYSFIYNGSYMLPETVITVIVALLVISVYPDFFKEQ